jgi:hypothetical protein
VQYDMTTTATPPVPVDPPPPEPPRRKRPALLILGSLTVLVALALLAGGIAAVWGLGQRDADGYFTTGTHTLSTNSYALSTESLDVGNDVPDWVVDDFATVRVQARSSVPVFLGVGPARDVERYLAGVQHDQITDFDTDPFSVTRRRLGGGGEPSPPATQRFWRRSVSGSGSQTIRWPVESGRWSVVAMNADGSRNVSVHTRFGARVPSLRWIAIGTLAAGGLMVVGGAGLIYVGSNRRRRVL